VNKKTNWSILHLGKVPTTPPFFQFFKLTIARGNLDGDGENAEARLNMQM
jgi:hypothetical protein